MVRTKAGGLVRHGAAASWMLCCCLAATARAAPGDAGPAPEAAPPSGAAPEDAARPMAFDIPAQPLAAALERYAAVSRQSVLFRDEWVDGRVSAAVYGRYAPGAALRALLEGTGLVADRVEGSQDRMDAFVLRMEGAPSPLPGAPAPAEPDRDYDALVQARVWRALCGNVHTMPGHYRSILRFGVDQAGRLSQPRLLASTGDRRRDAAILGVLGGVRIEQPPAPGLPQPLTLAVLPFDAIGQTRLCATAH
ncbi:hypothetical protein GCM10023144_38270 [Pigmentiphaga soli]|uniref:Secretin/TonB short N-terminal domain-containing protein n=1 Tax=Pigmentiphaga soli TaxID=1007095 RepID=A0ABP8HI78_9BURK